MSLIQVWIHLVWSTKDREPLLTKEIRTQVFRHIIKNSEEKGITVDSINGESDHVHCIIQLQSNQSISKIAQLIKGESSYWINQNLFTEKKFEWQKDYYAESISDSWVPNLRRYLAIQEIRHKDKSFQKKFEKILGNFKKDDDRNEL